jgi:hypothetical protein
MKKPQHLAALACLLLQQKMNDKLRSGAQPKGPYPNPSTAESAGNSREQPALSASNSSREVV